MPDVYINGPTVSLRTCCTICIVYLRFRPQNIAIFRELPSILCCMRHNIVLLHLGMRSSVCKVHRLQIYAYIVCTNVLWKSNIKIYRRVETSRWHITNRHAVLKVCLFSNGHTIWEGFRIEMGLSEFTSLLPSAKVCYQLADVRLSHQVPDVRLSHHTCGSSVCFPCHRKTHKFAFQVWELAPGAAVMCCLCTGARPQVLYCETCIRDFET